MKKIILVFVCSLSLQAFASNENLQENQLLHCARAIVAKKKIDVYDVGIIADLFLSRELPLQERLDDCRALKKSLPRLKPRVNNESVIHQVTLSPEEKEILLSFANPDYQCAGHIVATGATVGLGLDVDVKTMACRGTDGSQFLVVVPKIAVAVGFGAGVVIGAVIDYSYCRHSDYEDQNPGVNMFIALGIAFRGNETHAQPAFGVGIGGYVTTNEPYSYFAPRIKVMPLPSHYKEIKKLLGW